ncbi:MAG: MBOAT family O-acyltransferase [Alphaproteobacteria bacterium]
MIGQIFLILASLVFYAWWDIRYLPLLLGSVIVNFTISQFLSPDSGVRPYYRKILLILGIVSNLSVLCYFKYFDFFLNNSNFFLGTNWEILNLALPLAISFFTLQQIAFLVDVYEGLTKEKRFLNYLLFVSFFPQLIAGPIVHHRAMMPQFDNLRNRFLNYQNISKGLFIFSMGLFKKVMIADQLEIYSSAFYSDPAALSVIDAWLASYLFAFQLYFDFSGYSDMAIGLGLLFNIKLPLNFNSPFKANNIIDFWRRWHITLGDFIRTYVFSALLRTRKKVTYLYSLWALFMAMLLLGIWHGASWNFFFFGLIHAFGVITHSLWQKTNIRLNTFVSWFLTLNFVIVSLIFASADTTQNAFIALSKMFFIDRVAFDIGSTLSMLDLTSVCDVDTLIFSCDMLRHMNILFLAAAILCVFFTKNAYEWMEQQKPTLFYIVFNLFLFLIPIIFISEVKEFIYFQF